MHGATLIQMETLNPSLMCILVLFILTRIIKSKSSFCLSKSDHAFNLAQLHVRRKVIFVGDIEEDYGDNQRLHILLDTSDMKWTTKSWSLSCPHLFDNLDESPHAKLMWIFGQTYFVHMTLALDDSKSKLNFYSFDYMQSSCHLKHSKELNLSKNNSTSKITNFNLDFLYYVNANTG